MNKQLVWHFRFIPPDADKRSTPCSVFTNTTQAGFTLLEFLIVLAIIAVLAQLSTSAFRGPTEKQTIHRETRKLAKLVSLAMQHASLNSQTIGLRINRHYYFFVIRQGDGWNLLKDKLLRKTRLPQPLRLEFDNQFDNQNNSNTNNDEVNVANTPQILISASGELSPFTVRIIGATNNAYYQLSGSFTGQLKIANLEQQP